MSFVFKSHMLGNLADVPVLAESADKIAAIGPYWEYFRSGKEMKKRLFLNRIRPNRARARVNIQLERIIFIAPNSTKTRFP